MQHGCGTVLYKNSSIHYGVGWGTSVEKNKSVWLGKSVGWGKGV